MNHKFECVPLSRLSTMPTSTDYGLKYWLQAIGIVLNAVCWKCGMGEETIEYTSGACISDQPHCHSGS